jgi:hypothetical protein
MTLLAVDAADTILLYRVRVANPAADDFILHAT